MAEGGEGGGGFRSGDGYHSRGGGSTNRNYYGQSSSDGSYVNLEGPSGPYLSRSCYNGGGGSGSSCYVATKVYGDINHSNVNKLREFRDFNLSKSFIGRKFISYYYAGFGELMADKIDTKYPKLKKILKLIIDNFVKALPNYEDRHDKNYCKYQSELQKNPKKLTNNLIKFIKKELKRRNKNHIVVALSGGIDSSTLAVLCKLTGIPTTLVTIIDSKRMIYEDIRDAKMIAEHAGLEHICIDNTHINDCVDTNSVHLQMGIRKALIIEEAEKRNAVLIGSGNFSEMYLRLYCFNNVIGELFPFSKLYKTQVYALAKHLNLPKHMWDKPSHSGVINEVTDEDNYGFNFEYSDIVMYLLLKKKFSYNKITSLLGTNINFVKGLKDNLNKAEIELSFTEYS